MICKYKLINLFLISHTNMKLLKILNLKKAMNYLKKYFMLGLLMHLLKLFFQDQETENGLLNL
jgi:hypothetical protein